MSSELSPTEISSELSFRPTKRRKFYRKRADTNDDENTFAPSPGENTAPPPELLTVEELIAQNGHIPTAEAHTEEEEEEETALSIAEILRQRKAAQRRKGGIDFSTTNTAAILPPPNDALIVKEDPIEQLTAVVDRFAPQTGQVADVDKHM